MTITETPTTPMVPATEPYRIGADTFLIPNLVPAEPGTFVSVHTLVILAKEPVVVDTGAPLHRDQWLANVSAVVDPTDVRWVFLSHDDGDHLGNMAPFLDLAPNARIVANFFANERAALEPERRLPLDRQVWLDEGSSFDAGDRRLHLFRPPIFDGPTTRGLYDERSGVMWAVDSFAALTTGAVYDAADLPPDLFDETFRLFNSMIVTPATSTPCRPSPPPRWLPHTDRCCAARSSPTPSTGSERWLANPSSHRQGRRPSTPSWPTPSSHQPT
jgi:hypothetical protein